MKSIVWQDDTIGAEYITGETVRVNGGRFTL